MRTATTIDRAIRQARRKERCREEDDHYPEHTCAGEVIHLSFCLEKSGERSLKFGVIVLSKDGGDVDDESGR